MAKIINHKGKEVEREKEQYTVKELDSMADVVTIYMAMHNKKDIDEILDKLTQVEASHVLRGGFYDYVRLSLK